MTEDKKTAAKSASKPAAQKSKPATKPRASKPKKMKPNDIEVMTKVANEISDTPSKFVSPLVKRLKEERGLKVENADDQGRALDGKKIVVSMLGIKAKGLPYLNVAMRNWSNKARRQLAKQ